MPESVPDVETDRISPRNTPITTDFHLTTPQILPSTLMESENAMIFQAVASIGARCEVSQSISKFVSLSKVIEQILPDGVYLHLLLTCQNVCEVAGNGPFQLFPLQSTLLHETLAGTNTRSASTSQALRDAFFVAYQNRRSNTYDTEVQEWNVPVSCENKAEESQRSDEAHPLRRHRDRAASITFPAWIPYTPSENEISTG